MKFEIEIKEFWIEEGELTEALQSHIKREVIQQISASIKERVEVCITTRVQEFVDKKLAVIVQETLDECIATGTIMVDRKPVPIIDHVKRLFENNHGWSNPGQRMADIAKKFGDDLKIQYNNIFAASIVKQMHAQGFLKDDMAKILLGEDSKTRN